MTAPPQSTTPGQTVLDLAYSRTGYDWNSIQIAKKILRGEQPSLNQLDCLARERSRAFFADPRNHTWNTITEREKTIYDEAERDCLKSSAPGDWESFK